MVWRIGDSLFVFIVSVVGVEVRAMCLAAWVDRECLGNCHLRYTGELGRGKDGLREAGLCWCRLNEWSI